MWTFKYTAFQKNSSVNANWAHNNKKGWTSNIFNKGKPDTGIFSFLLVSGEFLNQRCVAVQNSWGFECGNAFEIIAAA